MCQSLLNSAVVLALPYQQKHVAVFFITTYIYTPPKLCLQRSLLIRHAPLTLSSPLDIARNRIIPWFLPRRQITTIQSRAIDDSVLQHSPCPFVRSKTGHGGGIGGEDTAQFKPFTLSSYNRPVHSRCCWCIIGFYCPSKVHLKALIMSQP